VLPHLRILDAIQAAARLNPDAIALIAPDGAHASYAELTSLVSGGAARLRALGIEPADRVAIVVPDGPEALTAFLAVSEAAVAAPINPAVPQSEKRRAHPRHRAVTNPPDFAAAPLAVVQPHRRRAPAGQPRSAPAAAQRGTAARNDPALPESAGRRPVRRSYL
jgi:acyl-CoA synthetase (AMP-forming)/AMP-acid ligase II